MTLTDLQQQYSIVATIDLAAWTDNYETSTDWLRRALHAIHQNAYSDNERIVFLHSHDYYVKNQERVGIVLRNLQTALNEVDISTFFAVVLSTNPDIDQEMILINHASADPVPIQHYRVEGEFAATELERHPYSRAEQYQYGSANPIKINLKDIGAKDRYLLSESKEFCIYPWIHMHAWPTGEAYPCCHATQHPKYGNAREQPLEQIWNDAPMRRLRRDMLADQPNETCRKCHEQEESGFFSGRQSANKHHGHHINRVHATQPDGTLEKFEMTYWDIRFSNLCNLKCRSCGHIFSSQWYQDQAKLAGGDWKLHNKVLNYAGRTETDMWEQLLPHLDYVEQIYFAGGEPLLMEEHYRILEELLKRGRTDVRLIYNTNFTHTDLKGRSVFEYWNQFESVAVGASLDDSGARGEYIRKGTDWAQVEQNRRDMLKICPQVDFYISPTLSIMNALHLPDFHRDWVEKGLLRAQDLNVNILQDPVYYRIDIAPSEYKAEITKKFREHLEWLRPLDHLQRASVGFESAINFMNSTDNTHLIDTFWRKTHELDDIRKERCLDVIPELKALK
jgi:sulfatase maturation enzyme AslB (radical SAM superfamily)